MRSFRRILHATDFSPASRPAFAKAVQLARTHRAQLIVAHVLSMPTLLPDAITVPRVWEELERGQRLSAQRRLGRLVARARAAGVRASATLVDVGLTHERIARVAKARRADLIVMGTHGRSGLTKAILGSVAARVVATAPCPVMTVRAG